MRPRKPIQLALLALCMFAGIVRAENDRGVISGTVRLSGPIPTVRMVTVASDACGSATRPAQSLSLGPKQTVRNVIIYLAGSPATTPNSANGPAVLDQRDCEFVPRIQIVRSGAPLVLRNSDPVLHVVRIDSMSGTNAARTLLNVATPYAGFGKTYQLANFREPTLLQVTSGNGEDWMAGYVAVMPHPWAALTDENGRYELRNVPPGRHKIYAWHEVLGTLTKDVRVNGDRGATVDFQFTAAR